MSTVLQTGPAVVVGSPPPAPLGAEAGTIPLRVALLLAYIHDLDRVLADAGQIDWVSDAADSFRGLLEQVRRRRDELDRELAAVRGVTNAFVSVLEDARAFAHWRDVAAAASITSGAWR